MSIEYAEATLVRAETIPNSSFEPKQRSWFLWALLSRAWEKWIFLLLPATILTTWQLSTSLGWVKPYFVPAPAVVVQTLYKMIVEDKLWYDFMVSAIIVVEGFFTGVGIGLVLGFAAGLSKTVERFFTPTLNTIRQVPPLAWVPLLILWLGVGDLGKAIIVGKAVFFPVFLNTLQGIRGVSKDHIEVGMVFGYNRWQMLWRVVLPSALPSIFVGIRYGAGLAWAVMIAAEMLGNSFGLGFLLMRAQELMATSQLFAIIIIIGSVGFCLDVGLRRLESHLLRWRKGFEGS